MPGRPSAAHDRETELAELLAEVRRIEVQSRRLVMGVMAGGYSSVFRGAGIEFEEVREYVEGDDPRSVDWNVTARVGRPFVKKYVDERELTILFLLDLSRSMDTEFGALTPRRTAARVCACLALAAERHDDKVGLVAFGAGIEKYVPPKKGAGHALAVVRDCLALEAARGTTDLAAALEFAARVVRRRAVLFLVSDFLPHDGARSWKEPLAACAKRHDVIAVRLLAPELAPLDAGLVRVSDPESGSSAVIDWSSPRVRAAWQERVAKWKRETAETIARAGADRMDVPVPRTAVKDAVARPILEFFRMRELRGAKR